MATVLLAAITVAGAAALRAEPATQQILDVLVASYPEHIARHENNAIIFRDGTSLPFEDSEPEKSFEALLARPSIKDMFKQPYPLGDALSHPHVDQDPGRFRNEAFFLKMYGDCRKGELDRNLVDVIWLPKKWGKRLRVTSFNGVAEQLRKVSAELDALPGRFDAYLHPPAGTVNCRTIAGTTQLSAHGTGTAIDISTKHAHYWRWVRTPTGPLQWRNEIPVEIVQIFERHGFIWGGKWYHFDTMHFEYRPELIEWSKRRK